jgi:hypothetical protein
MQQIEWRGIFEEDRASKVRATSKKGVIQHARSELPDDDYTAVKEVARANGLSVAA